MATQTQYTCDVCGKPKGATNHWYALTIERFVMKVWPFGVGHDIAGALHICGEACLLKKISERLGRESFALPEPMTAELLEVTR